jgi:hypothetical protein
MWTSCQASRCLRRRPSSNRLWLAELHAADIDEGSQRADGYFTRNGPYRSTVGRRRQPFGPCLRGWPERPGGLRYCINSASLRFVHRDNMAAEGYGAYLDQVEEV